MYNTECKISPEQGDEIILAGKGAKPPKGYRQVSTIELRNMYGTWLSPNNLSMPMIQYLSMMLDVVRSVSHYKGVHMSKCPMDNWVFSEIIWERKPNVIVELGNQAGGSTMMLRDMLFNSDVKNPKYVIGVDISRNQMPSSARDYPDIRWIDGDAMTDKVFEQVKSLISPEDRVMIIDDSSHEYEPTLKILNKYSPLVTRGQYFVVEDTLFGKCMPFGKERLRAHESVMKFMEGNKEFEIDRTREKWFITLHPEGYLLRTKSGG